MKNIMKQKKKLIVTFIAVCMLLVGGVTIANLLGVSFAKDDIKLYDEVKFGNAIYEVDDCEHLFVSYVRPIKKTATVSIPDTIKVKGITLKVTGIQYDAFKGNNKIKKITIGNKMVFIGEEAFCGCKNLKDITINALNLHADGIQPKAFKGINSKAVIKVPEQRLSEYKKMLKAKGVTGKKQKVIGMKVEEEVPRVTFGPDHPLPEPEEAIASIGKNLVKSSTATINKSKVSETVKYTKGDSIPFSSRIYMTPEIYGMFSERESYGRWIRCFGCYRKFCSDESYALHLCMSDDNNCGTHHEFLDGKAGYTETYWVSDDAPCKVIFHFTVSEGLSYNENSIEMLKSKYVEFPGISAYVEKIDNNKYSAEVSGRELTVTIDNIKAEPFFSYNFQELIDSKTPGSLIYKWMEAPSYRTPFSILFNAEINDNAVAVNTVNASVSYSYKGMEKTVDLGNLNIYAASLQIKNTNASGGTISGSKFKLYKQKIVYNSIGLGAPQYFEIGEAESIDGLLAFSGIGEGKYRIAQTEAPAGCKKIESIVFEVSMTGKDGSITALSIKDKSGKKLPWDINTETGVINATIVNN